MRKKCGGEFPVKNKGERCIEREKGTGDFVQCALFLFAILILLILHQELRALEWWRQMFFSSHYYALRAFVTCDIPFQGL